MWFSAKEDIPTTVDEILSDFNKKIEQLEYVANKNLEDSTRLQTEANLLIEQSKAAKAEAGRAASIMQKIKALVS